VTKGSEELPTTRERANHIWSIADLLRGSYRPSDYGNVILPFTVLRRLDIVLEPTKEAVLKEFKRRRKEKPEVLELVLNRVSGLSFHNRSQYDFRKLTQDYNNIAANLINYIQGFSADAKDIFIDYFKFEEQIKKLDQLDLLYEVVSSFNKNRRLFENVSSIEMGYVFEELIRKFAESGNETAGDHFTPREVIKLMVNLLFSEDRDELTKKRIIKKLHDPACGTGGMLSVAEEYIHQLNPQARLEVFGQEMNPESYAMCKSDMLIKGEQVKHIKFGDTFRNDQLPDEKFDYFLCNPPFGVDWKVQKKVVEDEHAKLGLSGRFGAGLPSIDDGAFLFLQHMLSKMKPAKEGGSRLAIVFSGSPLFAGGAGSGPSNIRRWIIENDWLEAIIGLPDQLFYRTGISTYIWVLTNKKDEKRKGRIQLVNCTGSDFEDKGNPFYTMLSRSLGKKRKVIGDGDNGTKDQIADITNLFFENEPGEFCKVFENYEFGFWRITVERPLRLNFQASRERIVRLEALHDKAYAEYEKAIENIEDPQAKKSIEHNARKEYERKRVFSLDELRDLRDALANLDEQRLYKDRVVFLDDLKAAFKKADYNPSQKQKKEIVKLLSERDQSAEICRDSNGDPEPDPELRDYENIPLRSVPEKNAQGEDVQDKDAISEYFAREVLPHVADAWIDWTKTKVGYEINFTKYFYEYKPLRSLAEIRAEILAIEKETDGMIRQVVGR
jgi:type I restriction enzyme M protein